MKKKILLTLLTILFPLWLLPVSLLYVFMWVYFKLEEIYDELKGNYVKERKN